MAKRGRPRKWQSVFTAVMLPGAHRSYYEAQAKRHGLVLGSYLVWQLALRHGLEVPSQLEAELRAARNVHAQTGIDLAATSGEVTATVERPSWQPKHYTGVRLPVAHRRFYEAERTRFGLPHLSSYLVWQLALQHGLEIPIELEAELCASRNARAQGGFDLASAS